MSIFDYTRHSNARPSQFAGKANFAFADGHGETVSTDQLIDNAGNPTYKVMWSPKDDDL